MTEENNLHCTFRLRSDSDYSIRFFHVYGFIEYETTFHTGVIRFEYFNKKINITISLVR